VAVVLILIVTIENKTIDIPFYQIIHAVSEPGNAVIKNQTKKFTNSLPPKKTMHHKQIMTTTAWSVHRQCQFLSLIEENKIVYIIFQYYIFYLFLNLLGMLSITV
jgi:hypothetical protein